MTFLDQMHEEASIRAAELEGPNAIGYDALCERIFARLIEPVCGACHHMECDRCPITDQKVQP